MNYNTQNLIDQVYTNIDVEINDQKLITDDLYSEIDETILSTPKKVKSTKAQLRREKERLDLKRANFYSQRYAKEIQLIRNRFLNN